MGEIFQQHRNTQVKETHHGQTRIFRSFRRAGKSPAACAASRYAGGQAHRLCLQRTVAGLSHAAPGATNIVRRGAQKETKEEDTVQGLHRMAGFLAVPSYHYLHGYEQGTPGAMLLTRVVAESAASLGWTKQKIRKFLVAHSRIPQEQLKRTGGRAWIAIAHDESARDSIDLDPWPITSKPENLKLIVAGGGHPTHSFWLQGNSPAVVGRQVRVPETFDRLIEEAERDLAGG